MKSSRPLSAHWRSSNRRTVVARSAIRSKKIRHAANRTSRPPAGAGSSPSRVSRAGSTQRRSSSSGTNSATVAPDPLAGGLLVVGLGQPGPPPDHLAQRPERDPLAVRRRAAAMPVDRLADPVDVLLELPGQPALADPARAGDRDEPGPAVPAGRRDQVLEQAQLLVPADERRLGQVGPAPTPALGHDAQRPIGGDRRRLALERLVAGLLEGDRRAGGAHRRLADEDRARAGRPTGAGPPCSRGRPRPCPGSWRRGSRRPRRSARRPGPGSSGPGPAPRRPGRGPPGRSARRRPRARSARPRRPSPRRR